MTGSQFFAKLPKESNYKDRNKIEQAYWFAKAAHVKQTRDEGERYFNHPRRVALYFLNYYLEYRQLMKYGCPELTADDICTALMHDAVEDCWPPEGMIRKLFGENVERCVFSLSKKIPTYDKTSGYIVRKKKIPTIKYLKKMEWYGTDTECIIKMCDRLDNLRTMCKVWSKKDQLAYIRETKVMLKIFRRFYDAEIYTDLEKEIVKVFKRLKMP